MKTIKKILLSLFVFAGCSAAGPVVVDSAEEVGYLQFDTVALDRELLMPTKMLATCGSVIIYQRRGEEVFVRTGVAENGKTEVVGMKGRGPKEFLKVDVQSLSPVEGGFVCMDVGGKIKTVTLGEEINVRVEEIATFGYPQNGVFVHDGFIAANVMTEDSEYLAYSHGSDTQLRMQTYPSWTAAADTPLPFVYMKNMVAHPSGKFFASFYVYFRKLRIIDEKGNLRADVDVRLRKKFPTYSSDPENQYMAYASYPCATDEYIYALCFNSSRAGMRESIPEIQIWDWSGNLKKIYIPDRHIDLIAVDEEQNIIYGMDIRKADTLYYFAGYSSD